MEPLHGAASVPPRLIVDPDYWRLVASNLRTAKARPHWWDPVTAAIEAEQAEWRAEMLDRVWSDAATWSVCVETCASGAPLDVALMVAVPEEPPGDSANDGSW